LSKRRLRLETFLRRIQANPHLRDSEYFVLFLQSPGDIPAIRSNIKIPKRAAWKSWMGSTLQKFTKKATVKTDGDSFFMKQLGQLTALEKDGQTMLKGCSSLIKSHQELAKAQATFEMSLANLDPEKSGVGELFVDFRKAAETVYRLADTHTQKQRYQLEEVIRDKLAYIQEAKSALYCRYVPIKTVGTIQSELQKAQKAIAKAKKDGGNVTAAEQAAHKIDTRLAAARRELQDLDTRLKAEMDRFKMQYRELVQSLFKNYADLRASFYQTASREWQRLSQQMAAKISEATRNEIPKVSSAIYNQEDEQEASDLCMGLSEDGPIAGAGAALATPAKSGAPPLPDSTPPPLPSEPLPDATPLERSADHVADPVDASAAASNPFGESTSNPFGKSAGADVQDDSTIDDGAAAAAESSNPFGATVEGSTDQDSANPFKETTESNNPFGSTGEGSANPFKEPAADDTNPFGGDSDENDMDSDFFVVMIDDFKRTLF